MPSNKNRAKAQAEKIAAAKVETTGAGDIIYTTAAICPVLVKGALVYSVRVLTFTEQGTVVSIEEVDSARSPSTALAKLQTIASKTIFSLPQLRAIAKQLKEQ